MAGWTEAQKRANTRAILRGNIERDAHRTGIRPHEVERAVDIAETLWTGQKGNGQATNEAADLIKRGLA